MICTADSCIDRCKTSTSFCHQIFASGVRDLQVAVADVPEGSVVQLHVRDPYWARHNILKQIQVCYVFLAPT